MTRTLAIGDIHGCFRALDTLLTFVQIDCTDVIITLGDYIDRGPNSRQVIDRLIDLEQTARLIPLRGNHEIMMLAAEEGMVAARRWMLSGGSETLDSYNGIAKRIATLDDIPETHWRFLRERLLPYWETDTHVFVHGCIDPNKQLTEQSDNILYGLDFRDYGACTSRGKLWSVVMKLRMSADRRLLLLGFAWTLVHGTTDGSPVLMC